MGIMETIWWLLVAYGLYVLLKAEGRVWWSKLFLWKMMLDNRRHSRKQNRISWKDRA
jgi:hypothetical protein